MTSLFTPITRTDISHATHTESSWGFLNRVAHPSWDTVRATLDGWFHQLPDCKGKKHLRRRFQSHDDNTHASAIWELLLHRLFGGADCVVEFEPTLDGLTPDFLVTAPNGKKLVVEATTMNVSDEEIALDRIEQMVYEHLDEIRATHCFAAVTMEARSSDEPAFSEIRDAVFAWATRVDTHAATAAPGTDLEPLRLGTNGWIIEFTAHAGRSKPGRLLGILNGKTEWKDDGSRLRDRLNKKHHKYEGLGLPILLAVLSTTGWTDDWDVTNALFGQDSITFDIETREVVGCARQPDGQWYRGDAWGAREVTAVLTANLMNSGFLHRAGHDLWLHPDPLFELPALPPWTTTRTVGDSGEVEVAPPVVTLDRFLDHNYTTNDAALYEWQREARDVRA